MVVEITFGGLPKCRTAETSDLSRNFLAAFWQTAVMRPGFLTNFKIMTKEEIEVVQLCYDHLDKFTDIYPKDKNADGLRWENKMPENVKLTVYCKGTNDEGFLVNMTSDELGLEALIAQKWIIHSELEALAGRSLA